MATRESILAILKEAPAPRVEMVGPHWSIAFAWLSGAETDNKAEALARHLLARWKNEKTCAPDVPSKMHTARPEAVDIPMFLQEPVLEPEAPDPRDAEIAALRAALADKEAGAMFDTAQLQDLIRENETHSEAQLRWQSDYNQLMNRIVDSRLPPLNDTERKLLDRLQRALYAGRKGAVGIV